MVYVRSPRDAVQAFPRLGSSGYRKKAKLSRLVEDHNLQILEPDQPVHESEEIYEIQEISDNDDLSDYVEWPDSDFSYSYSDFELDDD